MKKLSVILYVFGFMLLFFGCKKGKGLEGVYQLKTQFPNKIVMTETIKIMKEGKFEEIVLTDHPSLKTKPGHKKGSWKQEGDFLVVNLEKEIQKYKIIKLTDKNLSLQLWDSFIKQGGFEVKGGISIITSKQEKVKIYTKKP